MTKPIWVLTGLLLLAVLAGCETVKGVGRDIEGASTSVQQSFFDKRNDRRR
jgi:predicted small secreted protein